jgi:5-hydroxyisourate hydrolase-like protein (transthyretin family)
MRLPLLLQLLFLGLTFARTSWSATLRASVVEDHSGRPVISAELQIARRGASQLVADIESDADGRFEPVDLEDGEYLITISKSNYIETSMRVRPESLRQPIEVRLVRCGTVVVRVADPSGVPVATPYPCVA